MSPSNGENPWQQPAGRQQPSPPPVPPPAEATGWEFYGRDTSAAVPPGTDGFAVAALVLGIVPVFGGVLGIVFGFIARARTARTGQRGRGMATWGLALGSLWLVGVIAAVAIGVAQEPDRGTSGELTTSGDVSSSDLRLHDCVSELPEGTVRTVGVLPCAQPHLGEVYDVYDLPAGRYPGLTQVERLGEGHCAKTLPAFLGVKPGTDDGYGVFYLYPVAASWRTGDRTVTCILSDPSGALLTGSAEGRGPLGGGVKS